MLPFRAEERSRKADDTVRRRDERYDAQFRQQLRREASTNIHSRSSLTLFHPCSGVTSSNALIKSSYATKVWNQFTPINFCQIIVISVSCSVVNEADMEYPPDEYWGKL